MGSEEKMKDRLVSRLPQPENLASYRKEVATMLEKNDKAFLREKWGVRVMWIFCVLLSTAFLVIYGASRTNPVAMQKIAYFGCIALYMLICGAVELIKHSINRGRVELLKEVKQVQLQVLELQELIQKR